jgi:hypothetical protein
MTNEQERDAKLEELKKSYEHQRSHHLSEMLLAAKTCAREHVRAFYPTADELYFEVDYDWAGIVGVGIDGHSAKFDVAEEFEEDQFLEDYVVDAVVWEHGREMGYYTLDLHTLALTRSDSPDVV